MNWLLPGYYYNEEYKYIICKYCGRRILLKHVGLDNYKIILLNFDGSYHMYSKLVKSGKIFLNLSNNSKKTMNDWTDFWFYQIRSNIIYYNAKEKIAYVNRREQIDIHITNKFDDVQKKSVYYLNEIVIITKVRWCIYYNRQSLVSIDKSSIKILGISKGDTFFEQEIIDDDISMK